MRAIWKYPLTAADQVVESPPGEVRAVAWQLGNPTVWIEVVPESDETLRRRFRVIATGERFDLAQYEWAVYRGSAISDELVFHVYEVPAT